MTGLGYKVYFAFDGKKAELVATTRYPEEAAAVAGMRTGSTVKFNGRIIWREGKELTLAGDSWDQAASVMHRRILENYEESARKRAAAANRHYERIVSNG